MASRAAHTPRPHSTPSKLPRRQLAKRGRGGGGRGGRAGIGGRRIHCPTPDVSYNSISGTAVVTPSSAVRMTRSVTRNSSSSSSSTSSSSCTPTETIQATDSNKKKRRASASSSTPFNSISPTPIISNSASYLQTLNSSSSSSFSSSFFPDSINVSSLDESEPESTQPGSESSHKKPRVKPQLLAWEVEAKFSLYYNKPKPSASSSSFSSSSTTSSSFSAHCFPFLSKADWTKPQDLFESYDHLEWCNTMWHVRRNGLSLTEIVFLIRALRYSSRGEDFFGDYEEPYATYSEMKTRLAVNGTLQYFDNLKPSNNKKKLVFYGYVTDDDESDDAAKFELPEGVEWVAGAARDTDVDPKPERGDILHVPNKVYMGKRSITKYDQRNLCPNGRVKIGSLTMKARVEHAKCRLRRSVLLLHRARNELSKLYETHNISAAPLCRQDWKPVHPSQQFPGLHHYGFINGAFMGYELQQEDKLLIKLLTDEKDNEKNESGDVYSQSTSSQSQSSSTQSSQVSSQSSAFSASSFSSSFSSSSSSSSSSSLPPYSGDGARSINSSIVLHPNSYQCLHAGDVTVWVHRDAQGKDVAVWVRRDTSSYQHLTADHRNNYLTTVLPLPCCPHSSKVLTPRLYPASTARYFQSGTTNYADSWNSHPPSDVAVNQSQPIAGVGVTNQIQESAVGIKRIQAPILCRYCNLPKLILKANHNSTSISSSQPLFTGQQQHNSVHQHQSVSFSQPQAGPFGSVIVQTKNKKVAMTSKSGSVLLDQLNNISRFRPGFHNNPEMMLMSRPSPQCTCVEECEDIYSSSTSVSTSNQPPTGTVAAFNFEADWNNQPVSKQPQTTSSNCDGSGIAAVNGPPIMQLSQSNSLSVNDPTIASQDELAPCFTAPVVIASQVTEATQEY
jgi:hypothetical protein